MSKKAKDEPCTVVEVRFLLKVAGEIDPDDQDALDHVGDNVTAMIDERCMQHRQNPPDPPESEPRFVDAAGFRVLYHGKDFG